MYEFGCFCYFLYCIELFDCIYYRIDWIREFVYTGGGVWRAAIPWIHTVD